MVARVGTVAFRGMEVLPITVEVHVANGLPAFTIVGLPDKAVAESKERVRAALQSSGLSLPAKRITVNLAPADVLKEGSHFDLPIALALLTACGVLPPGATDNLTVMGELGLDGRLAGVAGVLPAAVAAAAQNTGFVCPAVQGAEALWSGNGQIIAADNVLDLIACLSGSAPAPEIQPANVEEYQEFLDLSDIKGQENAKRVLEIAAAGRHNLLMSGPPGSGKSMLAARLPSIMPPMTAKEILETSMLHSVAGLLKEGRLVTQRPFRAPHHSASMPALTGGGQKAKPGEISLAHNGVLFLDELPEFQRATLEALRQPLESGKICVARANIHVEYPASFQLIAAMNPCRCGYLGVAGQECSRAPRCAEEYQARLSGPLLDRIDLHVDVPAAAPWELAKTAKGEKSETVRARVQAAWQMQAERYDGYGIAHNAEASGAIMDETARVSEKAQALLIAAAEKMRLSARGYHRVLRVSRTIADLAQSATIQPEHLTEALSYRRVVYGRS